jgi:hypothetical protein
MHRNGPSTVNQQAWRGDKVPEPQELCDPWRAWFGDVYLFGVVVMGDVNRSPIIVPYGADQTSYLVVDRLHAGGAVEPEAELERTDLATIIDELMSGQFNDPVRVIAFNTLEHWASDVSAEVAAEIQTRCDIDGEPVPEHVGDFVKRHAASVRPSALRVSPQAGGQRQLFTLLR